MQWLILYSHKNDYALNERQLLCAKTKNIEILVDQIGQNTKNELLPHKSINTHYL